MIDNFHNFGRTGKASSIDYQFNSKDSLRGIFTFGGSNFGSKPARPGNAGQDQRQRLRENSQSVTYQHIFLGNVGTIAFLIDRDGAPHEPYQFHPGGGISGSFAEKLWRTASLATTKRVQCEVGGQPRLLCERVFSFYPKGALRRFVDENGNVFPNPGITLPGSSVPFPGKETDEP